MAGNGFQARYPGVCGLCGEKYPAGTTIRSSMDDGYVHAPVCPDPEGDDDPTSTDRWAGRCPDCNIHHRGECY